jgi:hypothetical protein
MKAGREVRVQPGVIAKVAQTQVSQMHAEKMKAALRGGETFCGRPVSDPAHGDRSKRRSKASETLVSWFPAINATYLRRVGNRRSFVSGSVR